MNDTPYENRMRNAMECDTTECDIFYLHNHKNRNVSFDMA